jgi:pimeloyl-ACP methyl ester carboxylesterase
MLRGSFYDPSTLTDDVRDEYMRPVRIKGSLGGLVAIMRQRAGDPALEMERITQPVLIVSGAHDRIVPLSVGQHIRGRIPQARMVVIDKAGHLLLEEQPDECARAILDFMRDANVSATAAVTQT